jgi:hypothetical protein
MRRHVAEHNIYRWAASVLGALRELRLENYDDVEDLSIEPGAEDTRTTAHRRLA